MNSKKTEKIIRRIKAVMENYDSNKMKVSGNRDQLKTFMSDVHGDGKSVFCLDKIFDMHYVTMEDGWEPFPGLAIYRTIYLKNWHSYSDAVLSDEGEYLKYSFVSNWQSTDEIYHILMNKYPELQFKIFIQGAHDSYRYEIEIKEAKYEKYIEFYWKKVPWRANSSKSMLYKEDHLKKTLQVIEEEITFPEDTRAIVRHDDHETWDDDDLFEELLDM